MDRDPQLDGVHESLNQALDRLQRAAETSDEADTPHLLAIARLMTHVQRELTALTIARRRRDEGATRTGSRLR